MLKCCLHWWMNWRDVAIIICARMHRLGVLVCPVTTHILPQLSCLYSISIVLHILFQWLPLLDSFGKVKLCLAEGGFRKSLQRQWSLESLWSFHCFCSNHFIVIKTPSSYVSRRSCTSISRNSRNRRNTSSSCKAVEFFCTYFFLCARCFARLGKFRRVWRRARAIARLILQRLVFMPFRLYLLNSKSAIFWRNTFEI